VSGDPAVAPRRVREDKRVRARQQGAGDQFGTASSSGTHSNSTSRPDARRAVGCSGSRPFSLYSPLGRLGAGGGRTQAVDRVGRQDHRFPGPQLPGRRRSSCPLDHAVDSREVGGDRNVEIARDSEFVLLLVELVRRRLRAPETASSGSRDALVEADPEQRAFRLVAELPAAGRRACRHTAGSRRRVPSRTRRPRHRLRAARCRGRAARRFRARARAPRGRRRRRRRAHAGTSSFSASAIAPEPTPMSSTRGSSIPSSSASARFDHDLRLRPAARAHVDPS